MKIIFLDIDGVLNSHAYWLRQEAANKRFMTRDADEIDPEAVARLNRIVERTGAKVVISSTWRKLHTVDELRGFLGERGFAGEVIGATDVLHGEHPSGRRYQRGDEIEKWLLDCGESTPSSYVVLDDDSDMDAVRAYFIKTETVSGLRDEHVETAVGVLNGTLRLKAWFEDVTNFLAAQDDYLKLVEEPIKTTHIYVEGIKSRDDE